ncbi:hypothetical protein D3C87_76110 [compost metagenome]
MNLKIKLGESFNIEKILLDDHESDFYNLNHFIENHFILEYADGKQEVCILLAAGVNDEGESYISFEDVEIYYATSVLS